MSPGDDGILNPCDEHFPFEFQIPEDAMPTLDYPFEYELPDEAFTKDIQNPFQMENH